MAAPRVEDYVRKTFAGSSVSVDVVSEDEALSEEFPLFSAVNRCAKGDHARVCSVVLIIISYSIYSIIIVNFFIISSSIYSIIMVVFLMLFLVVFVVFSIILFLIVFIVFSLLLCIIVSIVLLCYSLLLFIILLF